LLISVIEMSKSADKLK